LSGLRATGAVKAAPGLNDVLRVASALVDRQGFQATSLAQIADAVGLSRSALGQFVQSKAELLQALVAQTTREILAIARAPQFDQLSPRQALEKLVREHCRAVLNDPGELRALVRGRREVDRRLAKLLEDRERAFVIAIKRVVERGLERKAFRPMDASIATQLTLDSANSMLRWYRPGGKLTQARVIDEVWAFIAHALGATRGARTAKGGKRTHARKAGTVATRRAAKRTSRTS
jgi:AcrR family transcriptional regulator